MHVQDRPIYQLSNSTRRLDDFILAEAKSNFDEFVYKWIVAASFDAFAVTDSPRVPLPQPGVNATGVQSAGRKTRTRPVIVGHFTVESYHAIAVSLALIDRAKLHCHVAPGYRVHTINHPLPRQPETVVMDKVVIVVADITVIDNK